MPACCRVDRGHARPWLTDPMVKYFAGGWSVQELAAIEQELERQGVRYTIDGDDLVVDDPHVERQVDMIVESITET
jgi:hypothetical protein